MEDNEAAPKIFTPKIFTPKNKLYILSLNNNEYKLTIQYTESNIKLKLAKNISALSRYYSNNFTLEEMRNKLLLLESKFPSTQKVVEKYEYYLKQNKVFLFGKEDQEIMILRLKKILDDEEVICDLELKEQFLSKKEILYNLCDQVERVKSRHGSVVEDEVFRKQLDEVIKKEMKNKNEEIKRKNSSILERLRNDFMKEIEQLREENKKNMEIFKEQMENKYEDELKKLNNEIKEMREKINYQNEIIKKLSE